MPLILLTLTGCAGNIRNISTAYDPAESVIVGHIQTVPILWDFILYDVKNHRENSVEIAGPGYGLTRAGQLQNQGYIFKMIRSGSYMLRLRKVSGGDYAYDDILRFDIPPGTLIYFGTIKVVVDQVMMDPSGSRPGGRSQAPLMFRYRFVGTDEDDTLQQFAKQYPAIYEAYKSRIVRIQSHSPSRRPKEYIYLPAAPSLALRPYGSGAPHIAKEVSP
jgi:hypothetical protein